MKNNKQILSEKEILLMNISNDRKIFLLTKKCGYPKEDAVLLVNDFHGVYFKSDKLINTDAGLTVKYEVCKKEDGSLVEGCFVLRPDKDPAAIEALRAYAAATPNKLLAQDIYNWVGHNIKPFKIYKIRPTDNKIIPLRINQIICYEENTIYRDTNFTEDCFYFGVFLKDKGKGWFDSYDEAHQYLQDVK